MSKMRFSIGGAFMISSPKIRKENFHLSRPGLPSTVPVGEMEDSKPVAFIPLQKAQPVQDSDGVLTAFGMQIAGRYAKQWVEKNTRDLSIERLFPELSSFFFDLRSDAELARAHAYQG